jgi:exopolyphosphatase/guanosine-5'-triphosphate,3'-diphosphate pyrophosphatase
MDKYALFEIGTTHLRLTLCEGTPNETFHITKCLSEQIHINQHIEADGMIKSAKFHECTTILKMYKKICEANKIRNYIAVAADSLSIAKNYTSFIDELGNVIGTEFRILTPENETNAIYTAVVNTLDVARGVIVNVSSFSTRIIHYSRRMILDSVIIPYGSVSLFEQTENNPKTAIELFKKELEQKAMFMRGLDAETQIVGVGDVFTSAGRIARKMTKYPIDIDHNYSMDEKTFNGVFDLIKGLDMEKKQKLKGISGHSAQTILCGLCIIDSVLKHSGLKTIVNATAFRNVGLLFNHIIASTLEKPVSDILHYSFDVIADMTGMDKLRAKRHYDLALLLFKQIRVLHKLPRSYAKALNIASHLYQLAPFGNQFNAILSAPILGSCHKDIVLASFCASFKKWEDFNMVEWLKYKDIMIDDDLEAVRKVSMILTLAEAFDIRGQEIIKDISCDLLGDSVILKLVTTTDQRAVKIDVSATDVEIFQAKKYAGEFQKTFKRSLELL